MIGNIILGWLIVGSCIWALFDRVGTVKASRGTPAQIVTSTVVVIVAWPVFALKLAQHPRWTARALKRNLWGRS